MVKEFGEERIRDTPISESAIVGAAAGCAATGCRPIVENLEFSDFITLAMDQWSIRRQAALYVRRQGEGAHGAAHPEGSGTGRGPALPKPGGVAVPRTGLKVLAPSTPYDAKAS
jgi:pyruvate dehydrogenase E1 component beta subunit